MSEASRHSDPGRAGVVPFTFACHRCGHCCTHGEGHVWVEQREVEALAARLGLDVATFARRFLVAVCDSTSGGRRLSLRTDRGRCVLLEGANQCRVYSDRPGHCRAFPYWPSVLGDAAGFERARAVCPGIRVLVSPERAARAFAALEALYDALPSAQERGAAAPRCLHADGGATLWSSRLEADLARARGGAPRLAAASETCPYLQSGRCAAREARPLACRALDGPGLERARDRLRELEREYDYPVSYAPFPRLVQLAAEAAT